MSVTDHYPRKKRRLCLNNNNNKLSAMNNYSLRSDMKLKASSQNDRHTPPLIKTTPPTGVLLPRKTQKNVSGHFSSDESCLEIGWDNNSPSPTAVLRSGAFRKSLKQKPPDISKLLKNASKKRKPNDSKESLSDFHLSTWMQENLAVSAACGNSMNGGNKRRSLRKRSLRHQGAMDFNEELKKFMQISKNMETEFKDCSTTRSPRVYCSDAVVKMASPSSANQSQSDSLLMMENFDDMLIVEADTSILPVKAAQISSIKTPKLKRNCRLAATPKANSSNITPIGSKSKRKTTLNGAKTRKYTPRKCSKLTISNGQTRLTSTLCRSAGAEKKKRLNDTNSINAALNDGLDDILSSQVDMEVDDHKPIKNEYVYTAETKDINDPLDHVAEVIDLTMEDDSIDECLLKSEQSFTKVKKNRDACEQDERTKILTAKRKNMSTPKLHKLGANRGLVAFEEDCLFDEMLLSLDDEFKCKSQETPPHLTADQRKMKTRSHTSPFPLSKKEKLRTIEKENKVKNTGACSVACNPINTKTGATGFMKETALKSNLDVPNSANCSSFISSTVVSSKCRRPFKPPNICSNPVSLPTNSNPKCTNLPVRTASSRHQNDSHPARKGLEFSSKFPLDLSVIGGKKPAEIDASMLPSAENSSNNKELPLSSTQRCSYSEIEKKRREAQARLKVRLRTKKS